MNRTALTALSVLALSGAANAQTIVARLDSIDPHRTMELSTDAGDNYRDIRTGVNNFTTLSAPTLLPEQFQAFCIDVNQTIQYGQSYTFTVTPIEDAPTPGGGMGLAKANLLRELWGRHYAASLTSNTNAAAFQSAIWEVVNDPGTNLSGGSLRIQGHGASVSLAQSWLDGLNGDASFFAPVYALTSDETQDMIVPGPSTLALLGLATMIGRRRR